MHFIFHFIWNIYNNMCIISNMYFWSSFGIVIICQCGKWCTCWVAFPIISLRLLRHTSLCDWNTYKYFLNSVKILSLSMYWCSCLRQSTLSPSACFWINWSWIFCLVYLNFVSLPWLDVLFFLRRYFRVGDKWVTPRNNCILAALLVTLLCVTATWSP